MIVEDVVVLLSLVLIVVGLTLAGVAIERDIRRALEPDQPDEPDEITTEEQAA